MSNLNVSSLQTISRETLASSISSNSHTLPSNTAIIDVRDGDHVGGHIRGSAWVPSSTLDVKIPELVRLLKDKETVVFHCALSQQRGPSAALRYVREKERLEGVSGGGSGEEGEEGGDSNEGKEKEKKKQKVVVLKGGFTEWQEKYGSDERLTEGWEKDVWEFGGY